MPSIIWLPSAEVVTETVVPGHTRTSPPRPRRSTAVSLPALTDDPGARLLPANSNAPEVAGAAGSMPCVITGGFATFGTADGSGGCSRIVNTFDTVFAL